MTLLMSAHTCTADLLLTQQGESSCMQEVLQLLRRRLHHSMLLQELESVKLRSSKFSTLFHIRDCIGRELVRLVNAPGGKLVELTRRQK